MRGIFCFVLLLLPGIIPVTASAQQKAVDTNYIADHSRDLVLRTYGSNKFTRLSFGERNTKEEVLFKPNSNYNIGLGFNYKLLAVNIGFKAPFVNNDNDKYGKTKYIDMQAYLYLRSLTFDLYAQDYEGYYLANKQVLQKPPGDNTTLIRSDLQTRNLGANVEYIFNNSRFSYRSTYLQNEQQKKSAGSFLLGGGLHYLHVRGDSAILPESLVYTDFFDNHRFDDLSVFSLSANVGYAYTLVLNQHFFATGSVLAGAGTSYTMMTDNSLNKKRSKIGVNGNGLFRLGGGYNSSRYYVGVYFVTNILRNSTPIRNTWEQYETGMLRISFAKRFTIKPKTMERVERIERSILRQKES